MIAAQSSSLNMDAKFKKTPIGEIPVEWEVSTIGQCAGVNLFTIPDNTPDNKKIRYIDISSIEKTGSISGIRDLFFRDAPSRARRKIEAGDILVSTVRPYLRAFAMVHDNGGDLIASTGFAVLSSTGVNGEFLYQFVLSEPFAQFLTERMTGSNYPAVNSSDVALCPIPLPPTQEQKKIAEILSSIDGAIARADAVIAKIRDLKKALMQRLLTRGIAHTKFKKTPIGKIPREWEIGVIGDIATLGRGRVISKVDLGENPGPFPVYSSQSKDKGIFGYLASYDFDGDYVTWTTDGAYAGSVFFRSGKFNCTNVCGTIKVKEKSKVNPQFLAITLSTRTAGFVSHVGNPKLMNNVMAKIPVILPAISEQTKIAEILSSVDEAIEMAVSDRNQLEQTKKSLMTDLLTGRVRTV